MIDLEDRVCLPNSPEGGGGRAYLANSLHVKAYGVCETHNSIIGSVLLGHCHYLFTDPRIYKLSYLS